jgi:hypothetical protein
MFSWQWTHFVDRSKRASPRWHQLAVVAEAADMALPLLAAGQVVSAIRLGGQGGGLTNRFGRALHLSFDNSRHIIEPVEHHKYQFGRI